MAKRGKYYKVSKFSFTGLDAQHYRTTEQYTRAVETLFERAAADVAHNTANINPGEKEFTFDDYPSAKKHMEKVAGQLAGKVTATIERGSRKEWLFACAKNDEFLETIMETSKVKKSTLKKMQDRNLDALETFQGRKVGGMNLSQRVWKYVDEWKDHLEMALDVGLGDGVSAAKLARDVRQDLKDPNRLFRRVRDKHGNLVLSKHARAFHPGQGVYRSSVKNAQRLTRSEINMAYRESDFKRWQQLDFVVGFEIVRSNHEPHFECPLCDRLAGKYPKTFKFVGWHPQCMCKAIPILMDDETFDANELGELRAALRGTEYKALQGKNAVTEMPDGFMEWVQENAERQANWNSTPYFIRDNFMNGNLKDGLKIKMPAVEESGKIDYHVPFEQLSKQEQRDWQRFIFNEYPIDYDFAHVCKLYDIDIKSLENMMHSAYENNEYWREPELRAELSRVKDALNNAIATKKQEAERILAEFKNVVDESIGWIGEQRSTYEYAKDRFKEEQAEEYPNYVTFINSGNGGSLDVARVRKQIAEAKDAYNKALAAGRECVSKYGAQVDVTKLRDLLNEQRTEGRNALRITNEIIKECKNIKTLAEIGANVSSSIDNVILRLEKNGVVYNEVKEFGKIPTEEKIIERLCGGDMTKGSCASVAFAYVGNKAGLDVLDYRGGRSCDIFSTTLNLMEVIEKSGGFVIRHTNDFVKATEMLKKVAEGKEYYFTCGKHAAIIRKTTTGFEFLELQSRYQNGWKPLNETAIKQRFGGQMSHKSHGIKLEIADGIIDVDLLMKNPGFKKMLGYLNTNSLEQKKGAMGNVK